MTQLSHAALRRLNITCDCLAEQGIPLPDIIAAMKHIVAEHEREPEPERDRHARYDRG